MAVESRHCHLEGPFWRYSRQAWVHHLVAATFIASILAIIHSSGHLGWLSSISLRLASPGAFDSQRPALGKYDNPPILVVVDDQQYESQFHQRSPLARDQIADILATILAQHPKTLAIDFDLSPGPNEDLHARRRLDELLASYASGNRQAEDVSSRNTTMGTTIVLVTPEPVTTPSLIEKKVDWMQRLCAKGIEFARADLITSQGIVLARRTDWNDLASEAYRSTALSSQLVSEEPKQHLSNRICDENLYLYVAKAAPTRNGRLRFDSENVEPINFNYLKNPPLLRATVANLTANAGDMRGRVVFFGGTYGNSDRYLTPLGAHSGVSLHAAVFYSHGARVMLTPHLVGYLCDIVLGLMVGWLFSLCWRCYFGFPHKAGLAELRVPLLLVTLIILAGLMYLSIQASAWLLSNYSIWLSPAPMLIGMLIDTLLSKGETHTAHGAGATSGSPENRRIRMRSGTDRSGCSAARCGIFWPCKVRYALFGLQWTIFILVVTFATVLSTGIVHWPFT